MSADLLWLPFFAGVFGVGAGFGKVGVTAVGEVVDLLVGVAVSELVGEVSVDVGAGGVVGGAVPWTLAFRGSLADVVVFRGDWVGHSRLDARSGPGAQIS